MSDIQNKIIFEIINKRDITIKELKMRISVSERCISYNIKILESKGIIKREGANKQGYWKINDR